jgi:hypothetical protein
VYHQYTVNVGAARDAVVADMQAAEIGVGIYYPIPCHRQQYVMELGIEADLPDTDAAAAGCLSLPMFPLLGDADQDAVIAAFCDLGPPPAPTLVGCRGCRISMSDAKPGRLARLDGPQPPASFDYDVRLAVADPLAEVLPLRSTRLRTL